MLGQAYDPRIDKVHRSMSMAEINQFAASVKGPMSFWCWQYAKPEWWYEIGTIYHLRHQAMTVEYRPQQLTPKDYAINWWRFCWPDYTNILIPLLVIGMWLMIVRGVTDRKRTLIFLKTLVMAFAWPWVIVLGSLLVTLFITSTIVSFCHHLVGKLIRNTKKVSAKNSHVIEQNTAETN